MVTPPAVKVRCSQLHGCASCREPSPLLCSIPINAIHTLGSKSHGIFVSATITPHYPLYMAPSSLSTFTLSFGPFPELHCNFVLPSLHRAACGSFVPSLGWAGGVLPSWDCFQITVEGSRFITVLSLTCRRPPVLWHPEYHQSHTSVLSNCEGLGDFFCLWWVSSYLLRYINHLATMT